jgi:hypothetical protein
MALIDNVSASTYETSDGVSHHGKPSNRRPTLKEKQVEGDAGRSSYHNYATGS